MSGPSQAGALWKDRCLEACALLTRFVLGGMFLAMGLQKALHSVEFLKQVRAYHIIDSAWMLNTVAVTLPWLEAFCGLCLLVGIAIRGASLLMACLLAPFTLAVVWRAWGIYGTGGVPFCSIKFDCGCGAGEVYICEKVVENLAMLAGAWFLVARRNHRLALRPAL